MAEHHLLADIEVDAAPEIDRVNVEPAILLGLSSSEALWTISVAFAIWIPIAGVISAMSSSFPLFILLATSLPLVTVWIMAKKMAAVKRNRPDLYYVHAMRKWAAMKGIRRSRYLTHVGEWDVGRSFQDVAAPSKGRTLFSRR